MSPAVHCDLDGARSGEECADKAALQFGIGSLQHCAVLVVRHGCEFGCPCRLSRQRRTVMLDVVRNVGSGASRGFTYGSLAAPVENWCDANFSACTGTR